MAGESVEAVSGAGEQLIRSGWDQGVLIATDHAPRSALLWTQANPQVDASKAQERVNAPAWTSAEIPTCGFDHLVVASHPCDISKPVHKEPHVEFLPVHWTSDPQTIYNAKRNAIRFFHLKGRTAPGGKPEGLIADAALRMLIAKEALLGLVPQRCFREDDTMTPRLFRQWLGARFNRAAIPNDIVNAIQKPIVTGVAGLHKRGRPDPRLTVLDGILEVLLWTHGDAPNYEAEVWLIRDERRGTPTADRQSEARLIDWMADLVAKRGMATLVHAEFRSLREVSAHDYIHAVRLPLDQYSVADLE